MQPSRATLGSVPNSTSGLNSTTSPWQDLAFGWPLTSMAKTRSLIPIWGAASPTQ